VPAVITNLSDTYQHVRRHTFVIMCSVYVYRYAVYKCCNTCKWYACTGELRAKLGSPDDMLPQSSNNGCVKQADGDYCQKAGKFCHVCFVAFLILSNVYVLN